MPRARHRPRRAGALTVRVCLMVEGQEGVTWDEWRALAQAAEEHGLEGLFRSDHYSAIIRPAAGALDAWATLAALAAVTERLRLGTLTFSLMTACVIGRDRAEVLERLRRVQALLGEGPDPEALWEERRERWLIGTVDDVATRLAELHDAGVGRVFLQHLDHRDLDAVALFGDRRLAAVG